jgi:hypothetical protein
METSTASSKPSEAVKMLPLRHLLGVELFTDPIDAEARYNYWQGQGQRNVWLHYVRRATIEDLREPLTVNLPLNQTPGTHLYVLVRLS